MSESPTTMSEASARVQAALDSVNSGLRVELFDGLTDTAPAAAIAAGCELGQIVKSMLFIAAGRPVLLLIAGDRRADTSKLAPLLGVPRKRIKMASPAEVLALTGYEVGGVPPLGHPTTLETLFDRSLERYQTVYAAAGSVNALFETGLEQLLKLTNARRAEISS